MEQVFKVVAKADEVLSTDVAWIVIRSWAAPVAALSWHHTGSIYNPCDTDFELTPDT